MMQSLNYKVRFGNFLFILVIIATTGYLHVTELLFSYFVFSLYCPYNTNTLVYERIIIQQM
jgi:hypothetical protein